MCPRCKTNKVKYLSRQIGALADDRSFLPQSDSLVVQTVIICDQCSYLIFDEKWGWAEDLIARRKAMEDLAEKNGMEAGEEFLSQMGIPLSFQKRGVYYVE